MVNPFYLVGSICGFLGVALGAFGAHLLKEILEPDLLTIFETGVRYQMYHLVAFFVVGWLWEQKPSKLLNRSGRLFTLGILIFSGSLYCLALTGLRWFGAITPLGGLCLLGGWLCLILSVLGSKQENRS